MENSTTHPRIVPIHHPYQPVSKKVDYVIALAFFGVCSILSGIINLILSLTVALPDPANTTLFGIIYELSLGALILVSARAFAKGRFLSVWLYSASLIIDSFYRVIMGYSLNYLFVLFGLFLIWQILKFRNELELA